jgi:hypothetical protein
MLKKCYILNRVALGACPPNADTVVISITAPNLPPVTLDDEAWRDVIRFSFYDVDYNDAVAKLEPTPIYAGAMTKDQAQEMFNFIKKYTECKEEVNIISSCDAGLSRSAGVAKFINDEYEVPVIGSMALHNKHVRRMLRHQWERDTLNETLKDRPAPPREAYKDIGTPHLNED